MSKEKQFKFNSILLIDDNEIDNLINQKMIEASGFAERIFLFTGAYGALDFLRNLEKSNGITEENIPDLIFLDINMPLLDGFQFLNEYQKLSPKITDKCKVVMVSSSTSPMDMERSINAKHVIKYVNKPLSIKILQSLNT